jgi:hypothetical protein
MGHYVWHIVFKLSGELWWLKTLIPEGPVFIEIKNIQITLKKNEIKALFYSTFDKNMGKHF